MEPPQNCIFGDAMTVRLAPLKKFTSGYKIHCRSENPGPKRLEELKILLFRYWLEAFRSIIDAAIFIQSSSDWLSLVLKFTLIY